MKKSTEVPKELREKLAEYLERIRNKREMGFNQLALKADINVSVLNKIMNGTNKRINPYQLRKLAEALKIDYKALYKIIGYLDEEEVCKEQEGNIGEVYGVSSIPLYESISAGCGFENADITDYLMIPNIKNPELHFGVKVKGDSMEPTIKDGSIIVIKKDEDIPDGRIGAFIVDNASFVKRIYRSKSETQLVSDNRAYPPISVREGNEYFECGRVVKVLVDGIDL